MPIEIERKFRVVAMDDIDLPSGIPIDQGYLSEGDPTVRVRTKGDRGWLTIKAPGRSPADTKGALVRNEYEYEIPFDEAKELLDLARYRLQKVRYFLTGGVELDIFHGRHAGLILAEFESDDGSQPQPIRGVRWKEVTSDRRYSNAWIARNGIPEEK